MSYAEKYSLRESSTPTVSDGLKAQYVTMFTYSIICLLACDLELLTTVVFASGKTEYVI